MATEIHAFRCLEDNIGVLVHDPASGACAAIDAPEEGAVRDALEARGWRLTDILVTHRHHDHVGADDLVGLRPLEGRRRRVKYAVVTMCIAGGMGAAGLFEIF